MDMRQYFVNLYCLYCFEVMTHSVILLIQCCLSIQETTGCPCCCLRPWVRSTVGTCWPFSSPTGTACRPTATWPRSGFASSLCSQGNLYDVFNTFVVSEFRKRLCVLKVCVWTLVAFLQVWQSSDSMVNVCSELDWKRCVAVHLWFMLPPTASVADALAKYEAAFQVSCWMSLQLL